MLVIGITGSPSPGAVLHSLVGSKFSFLTKPLQAYLQFGQIVCASCQLAAAVVLVSRNGLGSS